MRGIAKRGYDRPVGAAQHVHGLLESLSAQPGYVIDKPYHNVSFYLPRSTLDCIAEQSGVPRIDNLACVLGVGHDDAIIRSIGASFMEGVRRPTEANQLFIDHMMLAFTAHVAQTYGGLRRNTALSRGGLTPWQTRRACERLESDLSGTFSLQQIAADIDLSVSHFSRAFRVSTGLPLPQWLPHQRIKAAKQLMTVHGPPLSEIAVSAGFPTKAISRGCFRTCRRQPGRVAPREAWRERRNVVGGAAKVSSPAASESNLSQG